MLYFWTKVSIFFQFLSRRPKFELIDNMSLNYRVISKVGVMIKRSTSARCFSLPKKNSKDKIKINAPNHPLVLHLEYSSNAQQLPFPPNPSYFFCPSSVEQPPRSSPSPPRRTYRHLDWQ